MGLESSRVIRTEYKNGAYRVVVEERAGTKSWSASCDDDEVAFSSGPQVNLEACAVALLRAFIGEAGLDRPLFGTTEEAQRAHAVAILDLLRRLCPGGFVPTADRLYELLASAYKSGAPSFDLAEHDHEVEAP